MKCDISVAFDWLYGAVRQREVFPPRGWVTKYLTFFPSWTLHWALTAKLFTCVFSSSLVFFLHLHRKVFVHTMLLLKLWNRCNKCKTVSTTVVVSFSLSLLLSRAFHTFCRTAFDFFLFFTLFLWHSSPSFMLGESRHTTTSSATSGLQFSSCNVGGNGKLFNYCQFPPQSFGNIDSNIWKWCLLCMNWESSRIFVTSLREMHSQRKKEFCW